MAAKREGVEFVRLGKILADTELSRKYPDLYNAGSTTYKLKGAQDTKTIISTFRIPESPPFGSSELTSLDYYFHTNSIKIGNSIRPLRLAAYKFKNEDDVSFDSSKLTDNTGLVKGTTPVIENEPLFFSATSGNKTLDGFSENFTGMDNGLMGKAAYVSMGRKSYVLINPYMEATDFAGFASREDKLLRHGDGDLMRHWTMDKLKQYHGMLLETGESAKGNERVIIPIVSHSSENYRTKVNRDDEEWKFFPKVFEYDGENIVPGWIRSSELIESDDHLYGDEVMPSNSIFSAVRGSKEVFETDNQVDPDATAAAPQLAISAMVKYTVDDATVGQCAQFFAYHQDNLSTDTCDPLSSESTGMNWASGENGCDAVAVIKNLSAPYNIGVPVPGVVPHVSETGNRGDKEETTASGSMRVGTGSLISPGTIVIDFTIPEMETAYATGSSSARYSIVARSFVIMMSNVAPVIATQRFRDYLDAVTGKRSGSSTSWVNNGIGIIFLKDKNGNIRAFGFDDMDYSASNKPTNWAHDYYINDSETDDIIPIPEATPLRLVIMEGDCLDSPEWRVFIYQKEEGLTGSGDYQLIGYNQMKGHLGTISSSADAQADAGDGALSFGDGRMDATLTQDQKNHSMRHMSFWLTNHINQKSSDNDGNINSNSDCRTKINIDSINFKGYNNKLTNATLLSSTGEGKYVSPLFNRSAVTIPFKPLAYYGFSMGTDISGDDKNWLSASLPTTLNRMVHGVETAYGSGVANAGATNTATNYNPIGPGATALCWGFDDLDDFDANTYGSEDRFIFLMDFICPQLKLNEKISPFLMSGGYTINMEETTTNRVALGCQNYPQSISPLLTRNALLVGTDSSGAPGYTASDVLVDPTLGVSNFTEKGFIQLKFNSSLVGPTNETRFPPAKRECVYASARILRAKKEGASVVIQTDCLEPFACKPSQEYIVYLMGGDARSSTQYAKGVKVLSASKVGNGVTITLDWDGMNDDNSNQTSLIQDHLIPHLWICPLAYWLWIYIPNYKDSVSGGASGLSWTGASSTSTYNNLDSLQALPSKSYGSCMVTSTTGTPGATFNEWMFSNSGGGTAYDTTITGLNEAAWDLSLTTKEGMFDLQDFGFGDFSDDEESNTGFKGGHVGLAAPNIGAYSKFRMPAIIETSDLNPNDFVALYISLKDTSIDHTITVSTRNNSTVDFVDPVSKEPIVAARYFDALPQPLKDFKVKPYEEDAYIPEYTWSVSDDDLWYGIIHVDNDPIYHQYHKAILHLPLNESSTAEGIVFRDNPAQLLKVFNYENGEKSHQKLGNFTGAYVPGYTENAFVSDRQLLTDPQGLAGNTSIFGGSRYQSDSQLYGGAGILFGRGVIVHPVGTDALKTYGGTTNISAGFTPTAPTDEFSLSMHITPDGKPPAPYTLKAGNIEATFSSNETPAAISGSGVTTIKTREALDATETEIDIYQVNALAPQYVVGELDGTNAMRTDYGTNWVTTGEDPSIASGSTYDIDDSIYIQVDDEIMKVTGVNPGTLTQITKNFACTTDVSDNQIDLSSHGFLDGTPVKFDGLTNTTGIVDDVTYYVSSTSNVSGAFRVSTAESGIGSTISLGGTDDSSGLTVKAACTLDTSWYNSTEENYLDPPSGTSRATSIRVNQPMNSGTTPSLASGDRMVLFGASSSGFATETMVLSGSGTGGTGGTGDFIYVKHSDYVFDHDCTFVAGDPTVTHTANEHIVLGISMEDETSGDNNVPVGAYVGKINSTTSFEMYKNGVAVNPDSAGTNDAVTFLYSRRSRGIDLGTTNHFTCLMHMELNTGAGSVSTDGEVMLSNAGNTAEPVLEDVTKIFIREIDENGRDIDGDDAAIGVPNCLSGITSGSQLLIELASDTTKFVWYRATGTADTSNSNYQIIPVAYHGGATGNVVNTFADEANILWSKKGAAVPATSGPCFLATGDTYSQANRIYGEIGGGGIKCGAADSYYVDKLGFWKHTGRTVTVERGFGGTTAVEHDTNTFIYRISDSSPSVGAITIGDIDDIDGETTVPNVYDNANNDQLWRFSFLQIGDEKMATGDMDVDSSWASSGWVRGIENTDWEIHDADTVTVIPRHYIFHSFTGNSTFTAGVNPSSTYGAAPVISAYLDSDGKINVTAYIENQSYKYPLTLKSKTVIPFDGMTPTHVGIVFDSQIPSQNLKLFLNGKLEDATGYRATTGTINNLQNNVDGTGGEPLKATMGTVCIGGMPHQTDSSGTTYGTNGFDGAIEDVCIWNRAVYFVEPSVGAYKHLKPYKELESGQDKAMSHSIFSKLFIKDYHNIRGKTGKEVRSSAMISIRKAAFSLNTS